MHTIPCTSSMLLGFCAVAPTSVFFVLVKDQLVNCCSTTLDASQARMSNGEVEGQLMIELLSPIV